MVQRVLCLLTATMLGFVMAVPVAWAQEAPVRIRGTIEKVEGDTYIVKARDGAELKLKLAANATVVALVQASPADIKQGSYIGIAGMPQADGSQKALEVHIFPEAMRGVGDGHRGWDLQPSSTMTNGNVEQTAAASDGQLVTLKYKDGEKKVAIPAGIPIVLYVPGEVSELKPGAKIFVSAATKQPDGTLAGPACQRRPRCGAADVVLGEGRGARRLAPAVRKKAVRQRWAGVVGGSAASPRPAALARSIARASWRLQRPSRKAQTHADQSTQIDGGERHHENERDRPKIGAGAERVKGVANDRQHGSQGEGGRNPPTACETPNRQRLQHDIGE